MEGRTCDRPNKKKFERELHNVMYIETSVVGNEDKVIYFEGNDR